MFKKFQRGWNRLAFMILMPSVVIRTKQKRKYSNINLFISYIRHMFRPTISANIRRYYKNIKVTTEFNFTVLSGDQGGGYIFIQSWVAEIRYCSVVGATPCVHSGAESISPPPAALKHSRPHRHCQDVKTVCFHSWRVWTPNLLQK